ncbi:hypothetical protein ACFQYP_28950 [Nonomuraea antimicrobica]
MASVLDRHALCAADTIAAAMTAAIAVSTRTKPRRVWTSGQATPGRHWQLVAGVLSGWKHLVLWRSARTESSPIKSAESTDGHGEARLHRQLATVQ